MADRKPAPNDFECETAYPPLFYNDQGGVTSFSSDEVSKALANVGVTPPKDLATSLVPVALRWRVSPFLGLPITPFTLWRKAKESAVPSTVAVLFPVAGGVLFLNGPYLRIALTLKNNVATAVVVNVTTLNSKYQENGGKLFQVSLPPLGVGVLIIEQPNLSGVKLQNIATVTFATGVTMNDYVNDAAWKPIQIVGLPFQAGSIDGELYSTDKQGFIDSLTDPEIASIQRTDLYAAFTKNSPATAPDGAAIPDFKTPVGKELLESYYKTITIKNGETGVLNDIREMLDMVYKSAPALYVGTQNNYTKEIQSLGVADPANPKPEHNGTYQNPVCSSTLLSVTTDCWHALGLGFGTIDFLPYSDSFLSADLNFYDYMVSATFRMPVLDYEFKFPISLKPKLKEFEETEYAAICHFDIQQPPVPLALQADTISQNRPLTRDDFYYEQVRLSWLRPSIQDRSPVSYAIAFKDNVTAAPIQYLNRDRQFISDTPQPFMPAARSDAAAADLPGRDGSDFERFFHDRSPVPFTGTVTEKYYVASQNVFGVWSAWVVEQHALTAKPPQVPRIVSATFLPQFEGITTHIYPSRLDIIVNYDWEDRTPFEILLAGYFVSPPVASPPVVTNGIMMSNAGGNIEKYRLRFSGDTPQLFKLNAANVLVAVPASEGEVIIDNTSSTGSGSGQPTTANPDMRTYRVKLKLLQLNFTSQTKLWFAVYVNGTELRNPTAISPYSKPIIINVADPLPREAPVFVPEIRWASLPDATNTSRYHLKFTPVAGAAGYAVYRATELSLRDRLNGITYPANGSIFQRRDALNSASPADKKRGLDAFMRVNKTMLQAPEIELEMDGDTNGLFIYAVSSFTDQGAESNLSSWIFVAVPQRITPAPPVLTGFVNKKLAIPKAVLKISPGAGNNTATLEVFRTTKKLIISDVNMMGLPASIGPAAGWTKFKNIDGVNDMPVINPADPFDYYKLEQDVAPGWGPYYYRAVGIGANEPGNGKMPGRSPSSNLLELLPPTPATAPNINSPVVVSDAAFTKLRISFKTDAYVGASPHGMHTIFVYRRNVNGLWDKLDGRNIPGLLKLAPGRDEPLNKLVRLNTDANGFSNYALNLPFESEASFKITAIDPLGRKRDALLSFTKPAADPTISNVTVQILSTQVNVGFKSTIGKIPPIVGQFTLTISVRKNGTVTTLLTIAMHNIPNTLPKIIISAAIAGGTAQDASGLFTYGAVFKGTANIEAFSPPAEVLVNITPPGDGSSE